MKKPIEVGKYYRTRSKDVVKIVEETDHVNYPFLGVVVKKNSEYLELGGREIYTTLGLWIVGEKTEADIIEELPSCASCGELATRECEESKQFVCGFWLCDNCEHDYSKEGYQHRRIP